MIDIVIGDAASFRRQAEVLGVEQLCAHGGDYSLARGKDVFACQPKDIRKCLAKEGPDIIYGLEEMHAHDGLHQRGSGLNHILCRMARDNGVAVGFSFACVLASRRRHVVIGRMMQNISLCRKFKVKMVVASFAQTPWEMRAEKDLVGFFSLLGMHPKEARAALFEVGNIARRTRGKNKRICDGARYV